MTEDDVDMGPAPHQHTSAEGAVSAAQEGSATTGSGGPDISHAEHEEHDDHVGHQAADPNAGVVVGEPPTPAWVAAATIIAIVTIAAAVILAVAIG